jgi:hypothetical protein
MYHLTKPGGTHSSEAAKAGPVYHVGPIDEEARPKFSVVAGTDGSVWEVIITLAHGPTRIITSFESERMAASWIARQSPAWLKLTSWGRLA